MKELVNEPIKVLLLALVTCGIYGIIWVYKVSDVFSKELPEENISAGTVLLLILITCGIYQLIWYYKMGEWLPKLGKKHGKDIPDEGTILLILGIFFSPASIWIIQDRINQIAA